MQCTNTALYSKIEFKNLKLLIPLKELVILSDKQRHKSEKIPTFQF